MYLNTMYFIGGFSDTDLSMILKVMNINIDIILRYIAIVFTTIF